MSSIAIFPCSYTPVREVIETLQNDLKLNVYTDTDLFAEAAERFHDKPERLRKGMHGSLSVFNQFTLDKEKTINMFRSVIANRLNTPDPYLFHGMLTSLIPPQVTHALRVLIVSSKQSRVSRAMEGGLSENEAKKTIRNDDVSAYGWTDFLFHKEAYDRSLYDLLLPFENHSHDELIEEIMRCYHKTAVLQTAESRRAVQNMLLETEVERVLLLDGHNMNVQADGGDITLTTRASIFNHGSLKAKLSEIAKQVSGVENVELVQAAKTNNSIYRSQKFELPSKVLFVDDEKEFVQTVSQRLISRDVGTYGVYNGEDALEVIAEDRPDVMVLDLKMPGLYGVEVLRQTKEMAPEVEVIILTGHGSSQDMHDCMELGAFAYLNKPVDIEELSATIKAANEKAHARDKQ
jgi:two-component system response regulator CpxR